jgi:hypothetical protein
MIVLMFADWRCWPTWTVDETGGTDNVTPRDLGLSETLSTELIAWSQEYDAIFDADYPPDTEFPSPRAEREWVERGRQLAVRVTQELGPDIEVRSPYLGA